MRYEVEVVRDAPLLHRQAIYEANQEQETLVRELVLAEYRVLPEKAFPR